MKEGCNPCHVGKIYLVVLLFSDLPTLNSPQVTKIVEMLILKYVFFLWRSERGASVIFI